MNVRSELKAAYTKLLNELNQAVSRYTKLSEALNPAKNNSSESDDEDVDIMQAFNLAKDDEEDEKDEKCEIAAKTKEEIEQEMALLLTKIDMMRRQVADMQKQIENKYNETMKNPTLVSSPSFILQDKGANKK